MNTHIHYTHETTLLNTHIHLGTPTCKHSWTPTYIHKGDTCEHPKTLENIHTSTSVDTREHTHKSVTLLLSVQVEWAGRVLVSLRKDLAETDHITLPLSGHSFDELLVSYATSALEFSVVQTEVSGQCQGHCVTVIVSLSLCLGQCHCNCYQ